MSGRVRAIVSGIPQQIHAVGGDSCTERMCRVRSSARLKVGEYPVQWGQMCREDWDAVGDEAEPGVSEDEGRGPDMEPVPEDDGKAGEVEGGGEGEDPVSPAEDEDEDENDPPRDPHEDMDHNGGEPAKAATLYGESRCLDGRARVGVYDVSRSLIWGDVSGTQPGVEKRPHSLSEIIAVDLEYCCS